MSSTFPIPAWVQEVIDAFDGRPDVFSEWELAHQLTDAQRAGEIADADVGEAFLAEQAAFSVICRRNPTVSPWPTYFQPLAIFPTQPEGTFRVSPDITRGGGDRITYWKSRASAALHPVLRARYADLVWDMASYVGGGRPEARFAAMAIDAYLAAIPLEVKPFSIDALDRLSRALELALTTRDEARTHRTTSSFFEYHRRIYVPDKIGTWAFVYDRLMPLRGGPTLDPQQIADLTAVLEDVLNKSLAPATRAGVVAEAAAQRLAALYERRNEHPKRREVMRRFARGCEAVAGSSQSAVEQVHWLERAHAAYQRVGLRKDTARVLTLLESAGKRMRDEMKSFTVEKEIPRQEMERYLELMTCGGLELALQRFTQRHMPTRQKVVEQIEHDQKAFISEALFGHRALVDRGYVVARIGTLHSDPENKIAHVIATHVGYVDFFRGLVIDEIRRRYSPTEEDLLSQLKKSPVFGEDQDFLLREGLQAYLVGDYVKCLHVLVPQFEVSLRTLASLLGLPTITPAGRGVADVFQARTLTDLLDDDAIKHVLGPDLHAYLNSMLATPSGLNIRNRVCHGLCEVQAFSRGHADILIHCLFALSFIRAEDQGPARATDPRSDGDTEAPQPG